MEELSDERWRAIWAARRDEILGSELVLHRDDVKEEEDEEEEVEKKEAEAGTEEKDGAGNTDQEKCPDGCGED